MHNAQIVTPERGLVGKGIVRAAGIAIGALACAHVSPSGMAPPLQCHARGLWTLERRGAGDVRDAWVILAMAPWDSWQTGFFTRGSVGCAFYAREEAESYRFRRER